MDPEFRSCFPLDQLPLMPCGVTVRQYSSHNRQGLNQDSSGLLYIDCNGNGVIFDAVGPGCVRSMWSTAIPKDQVLLFYFDDETTPRYEIPSRDFYMGKHPAFAPPLNSYELLGYYGDMPYAGNCFTPIPFADSLRIAIRGECCFHHILFEQYPYGTPVNTFTGCEDHAYLLSAFNNGSHIHNDEQHESIVIETPTFAAGDELLLLDREGAEVIRKIVIEADESSEFFTDVMLQMKWDGARLFHVNCPVGHFFGTPLRADDVHALPIEVNRQCGGKVVLTSHFPMPFWKSAKIKIVNRSGRNFGSVKVTITLEEQVYDRTHSGYFYTHYRKGQTDYGRDWLFYSGHGTGWFVGVVHTMCGEHYCEGDEHFSLDHACSPQINGTGTEDYYLACFWPNRNYMFPFAGCVGDAYKEGGGTIKGAYRTTGRYFRFHLEAPIPFYSHADLRIQHGGESHIRSEYSSLAFLYIAPRPVQQQTDFIDVANLSSEAIHQYQATISYVTVVDGRCEGDELHFLHQSTGRVHDGGEIMFNISVNPQNEGVRLRRRLDQAIGRQYAEVYIDGEYAGSWYHADCNPDLRWFDSDFDVHPKFTRGKSLLNVKLCVVRGTRNMRFTDFHYEVYCFSTNTAGS